MKPASCSRLTKVARAGHGGQVGRTPAGEMDARPRRVAPCMRRDMGRIQL